ncbi:hypothetical protein QQ045_000822 [Rhodiola kirilowii]
MKFLMVSEQELQSGGSGSGVNVDDPYFVSNNEMTGNSIVAKRCNDVVMSWLICLVSEKIVGEILHSKDVMTAWEDLESSYACTNLARKSALLRELNDCVQNGMLVCDYNRKPNSLYQEIDAINVVKCYATGNCLCCK